MYKKYFIVILFLIFIKTLSYDIDFNIEKYPLDTFLNEPVTVLKPIYDYNEITFLHPELLSFFSKHYQKDFSYSFFSSTDFKDTFKLDFKYNKIFNLKDQNIQFNNSSQITRGDLIFSTFLVKSEFQNDLFNFYLNYKSNIYPTILSVKNLSSFNITYKKRTFIKTNYQNLSDLKESYLGFGFLSKYGDFGIFYSKIVLPSYSLRNELKNVKFNLIVDALYIEKDTFGIFSKNRKNIYNLFPQKVYNFYLDLLYNNFFLKLSTGKILDSIDFYSDFIKEKNFYDIELTFKKEGKNFKYNFKINYLENLSNYNSFFIGLFSQNNYQKIYFINEINYYLKTNSFIYNFALSFNEGSNYLTFGIKNLFSDEDLIYSTFSKRSYFFQISFSNLCFLD